MAKIISTDSIISLDEQIAFKESAEICLVKTQEMLLCRHNGQVTSFLEFSRPNIYIGESLLTSLFTFLLISIRLT